MPIPSRPWAACWLGPGVALRGHPTSVGGMPRVLGFASWFLRLVRFPEKQGFPFHHYEVVGGRHVVVVEEDVEQAKEVWREFLLATFLGVAHLFLGGAGAFEVEDQGRSRFSIARTFSV